ncbi:hypothetical protein DZK26_00410 [Wenzhouxiangella sp. 15190]|nr:hypothetical protein DZK26_00410 [Wenzhouxiangella sp. 15190]
MPESGGGFAMIFQNGFRLREWRVEPQQNRISGPDGEIRLTPRTMDVLVLLAERAGKVVGRDEFSERVWSPTVVSDDALTGCIAELRRAVGDTIRSPRFIETIPKRGYRLVARVQPLEESPAGSQEPQPEVRSVEFEPGSTLPRRRWPLAGLGALAVALVGITVLVLVHEPRAAADEPSIAVLPFEAVGDEAANSFIGGLHHDLLTRLSSIDELRTISSTSVRQYQDSIKSVPEIARELDVGWVLEGSIQQAGEEFQLNAQLIDARNDTHIWANNYRRTLTAENLFAIQAEIVNDIATSLEAELTAREESQVEAVPTRNLASYKLYVQGRTYLDTRTENGMSQALIFFRRATEQDPEFALAWVGLADTLALLHDYKYRSEGVLPEAESAVDRALELNPELAEAHASLGLLNSTQRDGPAALQSLEKATELRPGYAEAHNWLSWNYEVLGFPGQALASAERAVDLDPLSPEALSNLVLSNIINDRHEQAMRQIENIESLGLSYSTDRFYKGILFYKTGRYDEAIEVLDGLTATWSGGGSQALLAMAYMAVDQRKPAESLLEELREMEDHFSVAMVLGAMGKEEAAVETLADIEEWGEWPALAMNHFQDSLLANLASDPRFESIHAEMRRHYGLQADGRLP